MGNELDLPGNNLHIVNYSVQSYNNLPTFFMYTIDIHYGSLHLYDGFMCLVALLTPLLFLYQIFFTTYSPPIPASTATITATTTTNVATTSPSVRTHRPHPAVLHNNARNSFSECDTASEGERCTPRQSRRNSNRRFNSSRSGSQRYSQKRVSTKCGSSSRSPRSGKNTNLMRESSSRKLRHSNSTAEYSHPSAHSDRGDREQEEHKEDGVRFSRNEEGLLLSTPPRRSRNNNSTNSPHRPHNATLSTPPHNKNHNNSSEARAIPTMFTFDRDLAVYTHETVTYDQLSAEKAAREQNTHNISQVDHLSQSFMHQNEDEYNSDIDHNGLNTPLYQSESDNLTQSEEEEEKQGDWSTDSNNECSSPKYALNMATTSYNSVNLSNKQNLYVNSSRRQYSAPSTAHDNTDYHTVRNTAMNRVSVHKAPSPMSTPPHSDVDYDSANSFGRGDDTASTANVRSTYSPASSVSGSVKANGVDVKANAMSDRPIWHSMFSDPSDGEEEMPLRRIPSIFTSPQSVNTSNSTTNTKPTRAMSTPLLLAPLHTNSSKLNRTVSGVSNKYANRPLPPLPPHSTNAVESTTEYNNNNTDIDDPLPVSPEVEFANTSIYSHASLFRGDNMLAVLPTDAKEVGGEMGLDANIINNYTETVPLSHSNKADSAETVLAPVILTVKCHDFSEDSANEGSVDGTMATLFGNNRNKSSVSSPGRVIVKPAHHNNNKGLWGMVRNAFGGGNQDNKSTKPPVTINSGLSGTLLRTMTDIDFNDIEDRESESRSDDNGNVYNNKRGTRNRSDSSGNNIQACYAYEGSSNFTEGLEGDGFDV